MDRICNNALVLAQALKDHPKVNFINYPGLEDNSYYTLAQEQFSGKFGGLLTLRVGSKENAFCVINNLQYALNASNIGDARTLVVHPASTIYKGNTLEEREKMGVYEDLNNISLLWPDKNDRYNTESKLYQMSLTDLGIDELVESISIDKKYNKFLKAQLERLCVDTDVINYRLDIM
jgi:O-acetylhomoserine (thiol)-lyase